MGRKHGTQNKETWRSRPRTSTGKAEGQAHGREAEMVPSAGGDMMRPKFDEADLALIELAAEKSQVKERWCRQTILDLVREVRIYQDQVLALQIQLDMCRGDERDGDD